MPVLGRRIVGLRAGWGRLLCALGLHRWLPLTLWDHKRKLFIDTNNDRCSRCGAQRLSPVRFPR